MSSIAQRVSEPSYYHREYKNDIPAEPSEQSWAAQCKRVGLVALPFLTLYKPLSFHFSLAMGGLRTLTCISQLIPALQEGNAQEVSYAMLQTTIAVIALAGTIVAHPLGMLISTGHDLMIEVSQLITHLQAGEHRKAMEDCFNIANNALYFSLFLQGGLGIAIASLSVQVLLGLYHSGGEFKKGNYLEGAGHLAMAVIRGNQLSGQIKALQVKGQLDRERANVPVKSKAVPTAALALAGAAVGTAQTKQQNVVQHARYPLVGSVTILPNEAHLFPFCHHTITLVNETEHQLDLNLFVDEGVPRFYSPQQDPSVYYCLPNDRDARQKFTDAWFQKQKGWAF